MAQFIKLKRVNPEDEIVINISLIDYYYKGEDDVYIYHHLINVKNPIAVYNTFEELNHELLQQKK